MNYKKEHIEALEYCLDILLKQEDTKQHGLIMDIYSELVVEE